MPPCTFSSIGQVLVCCTCKNLLQRKQLTFCSTDEAGTIRKMSSMSSFFHWHFFLICIGKLIEVLSILWTVIGVDTAEMCWCIYTNLIPFSKHQWMSMGHEIFHSVIICHKPPKDPRTYLQAKSLGILCISLCIFKVKDRISVQCICFYFF